MRIQGMLNWFAYNLWRHRLVGVPMLWWLSILILVWIALLVVGSVAGSVLMIGLASLAVVLASTFWLSHSTGHITFKSRGRPSPQPTRPLKVEEKILMRATGHFEVSGMRNYFADIRAWFETVQTREHIVIARNPLSRLLLFAKSHAAMQGLWYAFFWPTDVRDVEVGDMYFGTRVRPAVRVIYEPSDRQSHETLYLAFEDASARDLVLNDLLLDATVT
jgi:hypothetical protein